MELLDLLKEYDIDATEFVEYSSLMESKEIKKGDVFIHENKRCDSIGILIKGLMVAKYTSDKGEEVVSRFFYPPNNIIVSNHESYYYDHHSTETIYALDNSYLFQISRERLNQLYIKFPKLERMSRKLAEESYINALKRIHDLQSLNGRERVRKFLKTNKELINLVTRQHIASYLGINRNDYSKYLSRM